MCRICICLFVLSFSVGIDCNGVEVWCRNHAIGGTCVKVEQPQVVIVMMLKTKDNWKVMKIFFVLLFSCQFCFASIVC